MDNFENTPDMGPENYYSDTQSTSTTNGSMNGTLLADKGKETVTAVKDKMSDVKQRVTEQVSQLSSQMNQRIDDTRVKGAAGLRSTSERLSQKLNNVATYMEEHNAQDMSDAVVQTSKELVRKNPGKSLIAGVLFGVLIGRIFTMGGHHHSK